MPSKKLAKTIARVDERVFVLTGTARYKVTFSNPCPIRDASDWGCVLPIEDYRSIKRNHLTCAIDTAARRMQLNDFWSPYPYFEPPGVWYEIEGDSCIETVRCKQTNRCLLLVVAFACGWKSTVKLNVYAKTAASRHLKDVLVYAGQKVGIGFNCVGRSGSCGTFEVKEMQPT